MSHLMGYHRVSSESQSLELGREALIKAGVPQNRIYAEKISGKSKDNRPQLEAMLKALRKGDEVTVTKIDRLARNTKDLLTIVDQIAAAGASLNILDLGIKTDTPIGKMILTVLGAVSELERSYINERTRKGSSSLNSKKAARWGQNETVRRSSGIK